MRHSLFVYDGDDGLVGQMSPFLKSGRAAGERVVVVLERDKWEIVAGALGSDADGISYLDPDGFYTRPEETMARFDNVITGMLSEGATAIRALGQPRWGTQAEWDGWISYEAVVNRAFADAPVWFMCGYDKRETPAPVLEGAFETHREVLAEEWASSAHYQEPEDVVRSRTPKPAPLGGLHAVPVDDGVEGFDERLRAELEAAGVSDEDAENMLIAAREVLENARLHGEGEVTVEVGRVDNRFVCEVSDQGPGIDDPLAGFIPPKPEHDNRAGLWTARQRTRQLELTRSAHGFVVRLWV